MGIIDVDATVHTRKAPQEHPASGLQEMMSTEQRIRRFLEDIASSLNHMPLNLPEDMRQNDERHEPSLRTQTHWASELGCSSALRLFLTRLLEAFLCKLAAPSLIARALHCHRAPCPHESIHSYHAPLLSEHSRRGACSHCLPGHSSVANSSNPYWKQDPLQWPARALLLTQTALCWGDVVSSSSGSRISCGDQSQCSSFCFRATFRYWSPSPLSASPVP
jgi:hypothetical protein